MDKPVNPSPAELRDGVVGRLDVTLRAFGVPPGGSEPLPPDPVLIGLAPDPPGTQRVRRAVRIRVVAPGVNPFAVAAEVWQRGGCRVSEIPTAYGTTLVAHDPAGYILVLTPGNATAPSMLVVSSPPGPRSDYTLVIGIAVGVVVGPAGTCLSFLSTMNSSSATNAIGLWAWLPVLLVAGGLFLIFPRTRRFGTGLLIGGAATGIAVAGLCTALIRAT